MMARQDRIREKLAQALQPVELTVVNDSKRHAGHAGDDGSGESHFRVEVVSDSFTGLSRVERQRMIYNLLGSELEAGLHALTLNLSTPEEKSKNKV
jgi:BolA family transcriptional regulator, general stress-responsive regulator